MVVETQRSRLTWLWAIVPLVVIAELVAQWRIPRQEPSEAEWRAAAEAVRAEKRPDDLVVIAPDWATQGRMYLGDAIPMADFGRFDAARYGRIVELSLNGARAPETLGLEVEWSKDLGRIEVRAYRNPSRVGLLYDFVAEAPRAAVSGGGKGRARLVIDHWFQPRLAVPLKLAAEPTRITYPEVPLTGVLRVYSVVGYREARFDKGRPIAFAVYVDGVRVLARDVANFSPVEPIDVPLTRGGVGAVAFEAFAADQRNREFSVGAYVFRAPRGGR
ncbi:MAG: hypothetical protein M0R80_27820 [Proteobacteria bacterium]|jgi:hypothetical protein|nr:hypothetical protein [Pseudomonadota bacterium]